jgi:histidinol dehydrogenase
MAFERAVEGRGNGTNATGATKAAAAADSPVRIARLSTADFEARFEALRHWSEDTDAAIEQRGRTAFIADVRRRGDAALLEYTARFDGLQRGFDRRARDPAAPN